MHEDCRGIDAPVESPESESALFECALGILLGIVIFASLVFVAWPVLVFAIGRI